MGTPVVVFRFAAFLLFAGLLTGPLATPAWPQPLTVTPDQFQFTFVPGDEVPNPRFISVTSNQPTELIITVTTGGSPWLLIDPVGGVTPAQIGVSVAPAALAPGTYNEIITISSPAGNRTVEVTLFVLSNPSGLIATPAALSFLADTGGPAIFPERIAIKSAVAADFTVDVFGAGSWLFVTPLRGTTPAVIDVTANSRSLPPGIYNAVINILDLAGNTAQSVRVVFTVADVNPLSADPTALSYSAEAGSSVPLTENVFVTSNTGREEDFLATVETFSGGDWLSVVPGSGTTSGFVAVTVRAASLGVGTYGGVVRFSALGRTATVTISLTVTDGPLLVVAPTELSFISTNGSAPPARSIAVESAKGGSVAFQVSSGGGDWLSVTPDSGTTLASLLVSVNPAGLSTGTFNGLVTVLAAGSTVPESVSVTLTIVNDAFLQAQPSELRLETQVGDVEPLSRTIAISSTLGTLPFSTTTSAAPWLSITSASNMTPGNVVIEVDPEGLSEGVHTGSIVLASTGAANSPLTVPITLVIAPAGPAISSILHGASFQAGILTIGAAVSIFGRSLGPETGVGLEIGPDGKVTSTLAGVRALFDDIPSPLTYVEKNQINCTIPYALSGRNLVRVVVEFAGRRSDPVQIQIHTTAPGIFTVDSSGSGPGAILNQDGTLNSAANPADRNSIVSAFGTGGGQTDPPAMDGQIVGSPLPILPVPVRAWIGGLEADVTYAGGAPGLIVNLLQVNIRVPADLAPGVYEIVIQVGDLRSQTGVTIVVR